MKTQKQALNSFGEIRADVFQLFMNLFRIRDQKLGSGAYGEVWMAVDTLHQRQVACKIVKLNKSPGNRSGKASFSAKFWREVDLLKDISHVSKEFLLLTLAHQMFSQTFCTSNVSSSQRKDCMTKFSVLHI